jgi:prephenate dehydrogenase
MAVLGVGLIGGSLSLAAKQRKLVGEVTGFGRDPGNMRFAKRRGLIDRACQNLADAVDGADLVVFATPVGAMSPLARRLVPYLESGTVVTDVGSVKHPILLEMERLLPKHVFFVAAHPIAGTEHWGAKAAFSTLFEGQRCILTPSPRTDAQALRKIARLWKGVGSRVEMMEARLHDRVMGLVSHLPHMVAYALVNCVAGVEARKRNGRKPGSHAGLPSLFSYCGGAFRDCTRIASSRPEMWRDICLRNRKEILVGIREFEKSLGRIRALLEGSKGEGLENQFLKASQARDRILS